MKKYFILICGLLIITGCYNNEKKDELILDGTYKCVVDSEGIEYTMDLIFTDSKLVVKSSNMKTDSSFTFTDNNIKTINVVSGKELKGKLKKDSIEFVENETNIKFTCKK